mgnify:CR=1 FL=1
MSTVLDLSPPGANGEAWRALPAALVADPALLLEGARLLRASRASRSRRADRSVRGEHSSGAKRSDGVEWIADVSALRAHGSRAIERLSFETRGRRRELPCRLLAVHDGVVPNVQLSRLLGLEHVWDRTQQAFAPRCDEAGRARRPGIWVAGDGRGVGGAALATLRGRLAGLDIVHALGGDDAGEPRDIARARENARLRRTLRRRLPARRFVDRLYPALPIERHADDGTIVIGEDEPPPCGDDVALAQPTVSATYVSTGRVDVTVTANKWVTADINWREGRINASGELKTTHTFVITGLTEGEIYTFSTTATAGTERG